MTVHRLLKLMWQAAERKLEALWSWWLTLHWVVVERYNCMFSSCVQLPALTTTLVTLRGSFAKIKFY